MPASPIITSMPASPIITSIPASPIITNPFMKCTNGVCTGLIKTFRGAYRDGIYSNLLISVQFIPSTLIDSFTQPDLNKGEIRLDVKKESVTSNGIDNIKLVNNCVYVIDGSNIITLYDFRINQKNGLIPSFTTNSNSNVYIKPGIILKLDSSGKYKLDIYVGNNKIELIESQDNTLIELSSK